MSRPGDTMPVLTHGCGSVVHSDDGRTWLDLVIGFGAAFLGHSHPHVIAAVQEQSTRLMASGRYPSGREATIERLLAGVLPDGLRPGLFLSTGMEAAELAMRVAATHTGRREFAGFARSMHGKSAMTGGLCWDNAPLKPGRLHTLPYLDTLGEDEVLQALRRCLASERIAAVFIEPFQGCNGGHEASMAFCAEAMALCREHGSLCIMDEILTGLYRTGPAFVSSALARPPDLLLFAKSMGNGFPVSALALGPQVLITPQALPGSTFAGNPLALAAVQATLEAMAALPMSAQVEALGGIALEAFEPLRRHGVAVRGRGAIWCLDLGTNADLAQAGGRLREAGILATLNGSVLRLLAAAVMNPDVWRDSCQRIAAICIRARR